MGLKEKFTSIILVLLVILLFIFSIIETQNYSTQFKSNFPTSIWDWDTLSSDRNLDSLFTELKQDNINNIYLDISNYIDYYEHKDLNEKKFKIKAFLTKINNYIYKANSYGITVEALAGHPKWGNSSHRYINEVLLNFVYEYNQSNPDSQFVGIQYNIEPYRQDNFHNEMFIEYLNSINHLVDIYINKSMNIKLGITSPFWLSGKSKKYTNLKWDNESKPVNHHLYSILNKIDKGYLVILNYRNYIFNQDGLYKNVNDLLKYGNNFKNVETIIGLETGNVEPYKITFYASNKKYLFKTANKLEVMLKHHSSYKGFAIHSVKSYIDLTLD